MKIINLIEDTDGHNGCAFEHGLSFYIETANHKVLLDTGASDAFLRNAAQKGIDLTKIDTLIVSHGHYDHAGGVLAFAKVNPHAVIYMHREAIGSFYNCKYPQPKYIGIDPAIRDLKQIVLLDGDLVIDETLSVFSGIRGSRLQPKGNRTLKQKSGDALVPDTFAHEQCLVVSEGNLRVLLSGCAHNGILNILDAYRKTTGTEPTHVISGFHTVKDLYTAEDHVLIRKTAYALSKTPTVYFTGHCTGAYAAALFKEIMGEQLFLMHSGELLIDTATV